MRRRDVVGERSVFGERTPYSEGGSGTMTGSLHLICSAKRACSRDHLITETSTILLSRSPGQFNARQREREGTGRERGAKERKSPG